MPSAISRFKNLVVDEEPVISVSLVVAVVLAVIDKYVFHLTDDDGQLLAYILVPIVGAILARSKVSSPATVQRLKDGE